MLSEQAVFENALKKEGLPAGLIALGALTGSPVGKYKIRFDFADSLFNLASADEERVEVTIALKVLAYRPPVHVPGKDDRRLCQAGHLTQRFDNQNRHVRALPIHALEPLQPVLHF